MKLLLELELTNDQYRALDKIAQSENKGIDQYIVRAVQVAAEAAIVRPGDVVVPVDCQECGQQFVFNNHAPAEIPNCEFHTSRGFTPNTGEKLTGTSEKKQGFKPKLVEEKPN